MWEWCKSEKKVLILRGSGDTHMRHSRVESSLFCQICTTPTQNACSWRLLAAPGARARGAPTRARRRQPPPGNTFSSAREHLQLRPGTPSGLLRSLKVCNCRQFWPSEAQICATVDNSSPRKLKSEQLSSIIALGCSNVGHCRQYCSWGLKPRSQDPGVGGSGGSQ